MNKSIVNYYIKIDDKINFICYINGNMNKKGGIFLKNLICFCMSVILFCFGGYSTAKAAENAQTCSALSVKGSQLVNSAGETVQLKGLSTHGIAWYPDYINPQCFSELKQNWGINVIRLAMYTAENGGYCTDGNKEYLKSLIKNGVEYATNCNMYVIIDWHILSDNNPNTYIEQAKIFFDEMSKTYGSQTNVIYEICNEPNGSTSWEDIKKYAEQVIAVIRKNDPDNVILVGTPNWSQFVDKAAENPITGFDNIMYTLHFYAATHKQDLRNTMTNAIQKGLPIFVSEYGICDASGNGAIDVAQANEWVRVMNENHVSYVAWNLSNKAESAAILKSDCQKKNGFTLEELTESGKWLYEMLHNQSATQIQNHNQIQNNTTVKNTLENGLSVSAKLVNHWEQNGKLYYQYQCAIKNNTAYQKNHCNIVLQFSNNVTLLNGWNGSYSVNGNSVNVDCWGYFEAGTVNESIGFIICADTETTLR